MMDGVRGQEWRRKSWGGEVAKCVAMNPKNGMKRRLNEKKGKGAAVNAWA